MKVCIPFEPATSGGPSMFFKKLSQALAKLQVESTNIWSADCDVLLAIVSAPLKVMLQARRCGVPIVQRLDGVYYPAVAGWRWWIQNLTILVTYRFFSNWVVFQSEYSQHTCQRFLGQPRCPTSIIHNGVDLDLFNHRGQVQRLAKGTIFLCLLSTFWRQFEILPVVDAFDLLRAQYPDAQLAVIGRFVSSIQHIPKTRPDILWIEQVTNRRLPPIYRGADLMLSAKLRSHCPNAVIEAMACGLPVACFESGGHRELVGDEGGVLVPVRDDYGPFPDLDGAALAKAGQHILQNHSKYAAGARQRAEQGFGLETMAERYRAAFTEVTRLRGN